MSQREKKRNEDPARRRIRMVTLICCAATAAATIFALVHSSRPSLGKPYEQLSVEEARNYMSYETGYAVVDARDREEYAAGHLDGAVSIPESSIVSEAERTLKDKEQTVYVYGRDSTQSTSAAQKLSDMGYRSVSEIGTYDAWTGSETESEGLMSTPVR